MAKRKRIYTLGADQSPDDVFACEETLEERIQALQDRNIVKYRTKTIKSGSVLECEIYPIWNTQPFGARAKKGKESRIAQKRLNDKNALKRVIRLLNTNFTDQDLWCTFTYDNEHLPKTVEDAERFFGNFIRRLKYYGKKHGFQPLKYLYVTHFDEGDGGDGQRANHHIFTNFPDRDVMESLWKGGARKQTRRLQSDESGYEGAARYCMQNSKGTKRYKTSKNLKEPIITIADTKMTRRRAERIVRGEVNAVDVFEKMYKGYEMTGYDYKFSDYLSGVYIYVKMKNTKTMPEPPKKKKQKPKGRKNNEPGRTKKTD